jgi:hypothetical protein
MKPMSKRKDTYISSLAAAAGSSWWLAEVSSGFLSAGFDQYKESIKQTLSVCLSVCLSAVWEWDLHCSLLLPMIATHLPYHHLTFWLQPISLSSHILIAPISLTIISHSDCTHFIIIISHSDCTHFIIIISHSDCTHFPYHHLTFSHILSHSHLVLRSAKHASQQQQQQNETPILRQIQ